jgi:hypothetical protein
MDFEKVASYFSTSNTAFSQTYVLRVRASFSPSKLASQHSASALSKTILFSADAFAEGYNASFTGYHKWRGFCSSFAKSVTLMVVRV